MKPTGVRYRSIAARLHQFRPLIPVFAFPFAWRLANDVPITGFFTLPLALSLLSWAASGRPRRAFHIGLAAGLGVLVPKLTFLWTIFGPAAIALWCLAAMWHGLFASILSGVGLRLGPGRTALLMPFLWCGLEYCRCEIWWLKFSWLSLAWPIAEQVPGLLRFLGIYGLGFLIAALGSAAASVITRQSGDSRRTSAFALIALLVFAGMVETTQRRISGGQPGPRIAGIQLEFPAYPEIRAALDHLPKGVDQPELVVLPENTFDGPPPEALAAWCRQHRTCILAGGKRPTANREFFNTAFLLGPDGVLQFEQAKSVPIQFFRDGLPATRQELWHSPWGAMGVAICYDLSYRRVVDRLVALGARALIVPTMDVEDWGEDEHRLNAKMARIRAVELGLPILRVASSGISMLLDTDGRVLADAPFPGRGAIVSGRLPVRNSDGRRPLDHFIAPGCLILCLGVVAKVTLTKRPSQQAR
jgi:apolipoprotein N-acyltransferase